MLVGERRDLLLARLAADGKVLAKDVAAELGVSEDGVRRGLRDLAAASAAGLVRPGSTVILDGGTTTLAVANALPKDLEATVVTHSPTVAVALLGHPGIEVFLLGGRLFRHSAVTCGAAAAEAAQAISADVFLLGVTGVHPDAGLTTGDAEEAAMKRTLARRAADTYVLASAEKLGAASRVTVLPLADVAGVITDAENVQELA